MSPDRANAVCLIAGAMVLAGAGALPAAPRQAQPPRVAPLGSRIKGLVVDELGRPVGGSRVAPMWAVPPRSVTSHADGSFVLERNQSGTVDQSFLATADGGLRQGIVRLDGPSGYRGPRTLVRIVLRPAREVTVTVVNGHGAPVPDAVVVALDRYSPRRREAYGCPRPGRAPRAGRCEHAVDRRRQAGRRLRLLRERPERLADALGAASSQRPAGARRRAHRPHPRGRLGGAAGAGGRARDLDDPEEGQAGRGPFSRASRSIPARTRTASRRSTGCRPA